MKPGASSVAKVLSFEQALSEVEARLADASFVPKSEVLPLQQAWGRTLAEDVDSDRDYPPFHRSTRDGFAVRSQDVERANAVLLLDGEVRAGECFDGFVKPGHCVAIMTGAPLPNGADAVVMVEYTRTEGKQVTIERTATPFHNVVRKGSESPAGKRILTKGRRLRAGEMGLLASVGKADVRVYVQPRVAILPTGDEVVPIDRKPEWYQVRNSNSVMLAAVAASAGAVPWEIGIGPDEKEALRRLIEEGLQADLLLLSGGVSMGKYDFVEGVLKDLGAEFYFQSVAIRPGKPLVFGRVQGRFFFGLPGNPVSSFVTCNLFVRPAIGVLMGCQFDRPRFLRARLGKPARHVPGLTTFMPAHIETQGSEPVVGLVGWQGSGDLVGVAAADGFLVVHADQPVPQVGDWVDVMPMSA